MKGKRGNRKRMTEEGDTARKEGCVVEMEQQDGREGQLRLREME